jgi:hypothetical protein
VKTESHGCVSALSAALFVLSIPLLAQKVSPAFPRDRAKNVLDNETVAIWDVTWPKGKSTGMLERRYDQVTVTLADGQFESKGTVGEEEGVSDRARRAMVFEIKSYTPPPVAPDVVKLLREKKMAGVPGQFDAANGGIKLFENDKITVWQKTWNPRGSLHAHYSWIAGVWIQPGVQGQVAAGKGVLPPCPLEKAARTADGWPRTPGSPDECQASDETVAQFRAGTNITQFGAIRWGPPGIVHQEEGLGFPGYSPPASRAIFVEFKEVPTTSSSTTR